MGFLSGGFLAGALGGGAYGAYNSQPGQRFQDMAAGALVGGSLGAVGGYGLRAGISRGPSLAKSAYNKGKAMLGRKAVSSNRPLETVRQSVAKERNTSVFSKGRANMAQRMQRFQGIQAKMNAPKPSPQPYPFAPQFARDNVLRGYPPVKPIMGIPVGR